MITLIPDVGMHHPLIKKYTYKMSLKILIFISFLSSLPVAMARNVIVLDSISKDPISFALLTVMAEDSIKSYHADSDGRIEYTGQGTGLKTEYTVSAGFYSEKKFIMSFPDTVYLTPDQNILTEVVVSGQREFIKASENGFYIRISNNPVSKLATVIRMIQQLPFVDATNDKLSVIGKRKTALYIGNRKVSEESEIRSYSPEDIEAVEIVTEPGLKYGRDVDAVIIIHPKRKNQGLNLTLNCDYINQRGFNSVLGNGKASYTFHNNWTVEMYLAASRYGNKGTRADSDFVKNVYSTIINARNKYESESYASQISVFRDMKNTSYGIKYSFNREPHATSNTTGSYSTVFSVDRSIDGLLDSQVKSNSYKHLVNAFYNNSFSPSLSFNINFNAYIGGNTDTDYSDCKAETGSSVKLSIHEMDYSLVEAKAVVDYVFNKFTLDNSSLIFE